MNTERPAPFPTRIQHDTYRAVFKGLEEHFPGDPLADARWEIRRGFAIVGFMFAGPAYGWNRPHCSLSRLVWSGAIPADCADSRSENYGMHFDTGPYDSYEEALAEFAKRADRLIAWRKAHP